MAHRSNTILVYLLLSLQVDFARSQDTRPQDITATCTENVVAVSMTPVPTMGRLYVEGSYTSLGTCAIAVPSAPLPASLNLTIDYSTDKCGVTGFTSTTEIFYYFSSISFDVKAPNDVRWKVTCAGGVFKGEVTVQGALESVTVRADADLRKGDVLVAPSGVAPAVTMVFYDSTGSRQITTATVGDVVVMQINVVDAANELDSRAKTCTATDLTNTLSSLWIDGCASTTYRSILTLSHFSREGTTSSRASFKAFVFTGSTAQVTFECTVNICPNSDADCALPNGNCAARRKRSFLERIRRQAGGDWEDYDDNTGLPEGQYISTVSQLLEVRRPEIYVTDTQLPPYVIILSAVGTAVIVMIATAVCCIRSRRLRNKHKNRKLEKDSAAFTIDISSSKDTKPRTTEYKNFD